MKVVDYTNKISISAAQTQIMGKGVIIYKTDLCNKVIFPKIFFESAYIKSSTPVSTFSLDVAPSKSPASSIPTTCPT